jgi:ribosomal protein S18 acetylase RimI-like enzyme
LTSNVSQAPQDVHMTSIRAFKSDDLPILQAIRTRAFQPIHDSFRALLGEEVFRFEFSDWDQAQGDYLRSICAKNSGREIYVATVNEAVTGFIGIAMDQACRRGEIDLNAVDPEYQGQGIGELMYTFAIRRMKSAGMKVVKVSTGDDSSHAPARKAYKKAGFHLFIPSITMYQKLAD